MLSIIKNAKVSINSNMPDCKKTVITISLQSVLSMWQLNNVYWGFADKQKQSKHIIKLTQIVQYYF